MKLLGNNLVLSVERGVNVTAVVVGESAEYGLITHAKATNSATTFVMSVGNVCTANAAASEAATCAG